MEAYVLVARCLKNKNTFGMRVEKVGAKWYLTWAFPIAAQSAQREKYSTAISGEIDFTSDYPGCPHCGAGGFVQCYSCGKIACYGGETSVTCPWCGQTHGVMQADKFDLSGSDM